jgi:glycosyltransferase involved in cell wall biosynthesis
MWMQYFTNILLSDEYETQFLRKVKQVLVITYYWPPSGGSGVQRWLKFSKYLHEFGWEPVIYTPSNPEVNAEDPDLEKDILPGTIIIKHKITEPYSLYKIFTGKKSGNGKSGGKFIKANIVADSAHLSLTGKISLFIRGNFFIPDPRCWWIRPSVKYLYKYLARHPVDAIITTGPPHSMHLIGHKLHIKTHIPWIADFRDPWTEVFYFKHLKLTGPARRKHLKLEQKVIDDASSLIVVSEKMKSDFAKRTSTPIKVITNGYDPGDFKGASGISRDNTCFTIVHTGILVNDGNPDVLWEELGKKAATDGKFAVNLRIVVMGQTDESIYSDIKKNGLEKNFSDRGYVSHSEAIIWQKKASLLLLPLRKEPESAAILTGKFFEYLAAGSKILAFGPEDGELAGALAETGSGKICDWDNREGIRAAIDKSYDEFLAESENTGNYNNENQKAGPASSKFSRITLTGELAELLFNLTEKNHEK